MKNKDTVKRFTCDCGDQGHILEVVVERRGECSFYFSLAGKSDLKWRIKEAYKALRGQDVDDGEFILSAEDIPDLIALVTLCSRSQSTSGT